MGNLNGETLDIAQAKATRQDPTAGVPDDAQPTAPDGPELEQRIEASLQAEGEPEDREESLVGKVIAGKYKIVSKIGAGGMGVVYKAQQLGLDRSVAVKFLLREYANDDKVVRRFKVEALAASKLDHPNTIRIYDFGQTEDGDLFIAMEYLEGQSLDRAISREGPLSVRRVLHILRQAAASLGQAHSKGIVHRDLKPDNIFLITVDKDPDFVKVLDFGIAKLREADKRQGTLTQAGMIFGTPKYMAPEQCRSMNVDNRADIYALGVIAYEALTKVAPFDGETPLSILIKHVQESPRPFAEVRPDLEIPEAVERLVMRCLEKAPENRYQSMDELQAEIARIEATLAGQYDRVLLREKPRPLPTEVRAETVVADKARGGAFAKWGLWVAAALFGIGLGLGVWKSGWLSPDISEPVAEPPRPPATTVVQPAQEAPQVPQVKKVTINFRSEPAGAKVMAGGTVVGQTPFSKEFEASEEARLFTFVLEGFKPAEVSVGLNKGGDVAVTLERLGSSSAGPRVQAKPKTGAKEPEGKGAPKEEAPGRIGDLKKTPF